MAEKFYAAIDLGTNSCRLLISDDMGRVAYQDSIATRLGEGMQATSMLTEEAILRGLDCFMQYKQVLDKYNIVQMRAVGTAACRSAKNAGEFISKVYEKTGIHIDVISPVEEARLNLKGAVSHVRGKKPYAVVVDLGGGSTEIVLASNGNNPQMLSTVSIPWGSRTASDAFDLQVYDEKNAHRLRNEIGRWVDGFRRSANYDECIGDICFVATSSTPLRLVSLINKFERYDRDKCDGLRIKLKDINLVMKQLEKLSVEEMAQNPNIGVKRSTMFVAAVIMLQEIFDKLGANTIVASLRSVKDGIVEELIANDKTYEIS